jgi:D-alanyl-D-alanine carboxypeptidase
MRSLKIPGAFTVVLIAAMAILRANPPAGEIEGGAPRGLAAAGDISGTIIGAIEITFDTARVTTASAPGSSAIPPESRRPYLHETVSASAHGVPVVTNPHSPLVVVNKERALPDGYVPTDLVYPDVPFSFREKIEKRMLRREAAEALERMFAAAAGEGIRLIGISGYRSYPTQQSIFARQVRTKGEREAARISAYPGRSEHQTGLAIDVSSASVNYALDASFGRSPEGRWLARNAARFGFIVRYPEGEEDRTGYIYEPWHIRYVGEEVAREIAAREITLEEYFDGTPRIGRIG